MAEAKSGARPARRRKKKESAAPESRGIAPQELIRDSRPAALDRLSDSITRHGGAVIGSYRDPLGGHWQILAGLPIDAIEPTPYQRDLSEAHVSRLADALDKLGRYLDPIVVVPSGEGRYWTPNGNHRLAALRQLGARSIVALVVPETEVAHRILVLNTEKAHNLRERALEVSRLAEALAGLDDRPERDYAVEFEEPSLLTLGLCYQENGRFAGGAYHPVLRRTEEFSGARLSSALATRRERAARILEIDAAVSEQVKALKSRGFDSPYLRAFVVARINPLRFKRGAKADVDETLERMLASAQRFDTAKVRADQVARTGGAPEES